MVTRASSVLAEIDGDMRDAARHAARGDGVGVEAWVGDALMDHAASLGLEVADLTTAERREALQIRLDAATAATVAAPTAPSPRAEADDSLDALDRNIDQLLAKLNHRSARQAAAPPEARPTRVVPPLAARGVADAIADITQRQRDLGARLAASEPARRPAAPAASVAALNALRTDMADLGGRLDAIRLEKAEREKTDAEHNAAALRALRAEVADLTRSFAGVASRDSLQALERSMRDLARQVQNPAQDNVGPALRALEQRIDTLQVQTAQAAAKPIATLEAQTDEIRSLLVKSADIQARPIAVMADRLAEFSDRVEHLAQAAQTKPEASRDAARSAEMIARVEARMADLSHRLDVAPPRSAADDLVPLQKQIEALHDHVLARLDRPAKPAIDTSGLESLMHEINTKLERPEPAPPDTSGLERAIAALSDKIDAVEERSAAPLTVAQTLVGHVRDLAERVAAVRPTDERALADLRQQIGEITTRLDRPGPEVALAASFERSISELVSRLEETRNAAVDAAESTARAAVADALRDVPALTAHPSPSVQRDIDDLRSLQDVADRRVHASLEALNQTLETVVDRIARIESDRFLDESFDTALSRPVSPAVAARKVASEPATAPVAPPPPAPMPAAPVRVPAAAIKPPPAAIKAPPAPAKAPLTAPIDEAPSSKTAFIAAARRAQRNGTDALSPDAALAQAKARAQAAVAAMLDEQPAGHSDSAPVSAVRTFLQKNRRSLALSLVGVLTVVGALQALRGTDLLPGASDRPVRTASLAPTPDAQPKTATRANSNDAIAALAQTTNAPMSASFEPTKPTAPPPVVAALQPPRTAMAKTDPIPTGLIPSAALAAISGAAANPLRDAAMAGSPSAQYELGQRFADGRGMARDARQAAQWLEKAASANLAPAQYRVGLIYEKGLGVVHDAAMARGWYKRAADQGNVRAMHNLAVLTAEGDAGGKPDYTAAAAWFRKAAEFGVRDSQYNLAILYARGMGVSQDLGQSYLWFSLAAAQGDEDAGKKREEVAARMKAEDVSSAKALVEAFKAQTPAPLANQVDPPPGGWDAPPAIAKPLPADDKTAERTPKTTRL